MNVRKLTLLNSSDLGSVFRAFDSFQNLQLRIHTDIFAKLYRILDKTPKQGIKEEKSLCTVFRDLGFAYIDFGQKNCRLWKALFEYFPYIPLPERYIKHTREAIYQICKHLFEVFILLKKSQGFSRPLFRELTLFCSIEKRN